MKQLFPKVTTKFLNSPWPLVGYISQNVSWQDWGLGKAYSQLGGLRLWSTTCKRLVADSTCMVATLITGMVELLLSLLKSYENYRISSNRSRVSNTSRVSNRSRGRSKGEYTARLVGLPGISLCSNKYKTKNLGVLNTCSSVNRVVRIEAGTLIQAGL